MRQGGHCGFADQRTAFFGGARSNRPKPMNAEMRSAYKIRLCKLSNRKRRQFSAPFFQSHSHYSDTNRPTAACLVSFKVAAAYGSVGFGELVDLGREGGK